MANGETYNESIDIPITVKVNFILTEENGETQIAAKFSEEEVRNSVRDAAKDLIEHSFSELKDNRGSQDG